ncbi:MAG: TetR family transcriptional regulator [Acidimicrobiales bacterium]
MMAKAGRKPASTRVPRAEARQRVIRAAFETLRADGFSGTSARAIAATGGFDQALVFYYFGSVNDLLLAALADSSATQLREYEEALADIKSLPALFDAVSTPFERDLASGHVRVLAELVAASAADRRLADAVGAMVEPWIDLTKRTVDRVLGKSFIGSVVPSEQIAFAVVAFFLGAELLVNLKGDASDQQALLQTGATVVKLLGSFGGAP